MQSHFLARLSTAIIPSTFKGPIDSFLLAKSYSILIASVKVLAWESSWTERAKKCIYDWFFLKFNHNYLKIPVAILLARCQSTFLQLEVYVTVRNCFSFHATETLLPEIANNSFFLWFVSIVKLDSFENNLLNFFYQVLNQHFSKSRTSIQNSNLKKVPYIETCCTEIAIDAEVFDFSCKSKLLFSKVLALFHP